MFFVNNSNSVRNSVLKYSVLFRASILRILLKYFTRGSPKSNAVMVKLVKLEVKLRSCSAIFVKKKLFQVKRGRAVHLQVADLQFRPLS